MPEDELRKIGKPRDQNAATSEKKTRKPASSRDEQYEEGLRRTGLGDDAPGGASVPLEPVKGRAPDADARLAWTSAARVDERDHPA
jgi:hypothetical protein